MLVCSCVYAMSHVLCVCVCVCAAERKMEAEREARKKERMEKEMKELRASLENRQSEIKAKQQQVSYHHTCLFTMHGHSTRGALT